MSNLPTRRDREVWARVDAFADPVAEARRRWPDFRLAERQVENEPVGVVVRRTEVRATWSIAGSPHGLRVLLRERAPSSEVGDAGRKIARQALANDEYRKG